MPLLHQGCPSVTSAPAVLSGPAHRSVCLIPADALARASLAEVRTLLERQPGADLAIVAEATPLHALVPALERLGQVRAELGHEGRLVVRSGTAARGDLQRLARAGVQTVAWTVRAPTALAARLQGGVETEVTQLHEAMRQADAVGLRVQVRWRLHRRAVHALTDLHDLAGHAAAGTQLVVLPWLGDAAPDLHAVVANWPRAGVAGLELSRSALWPACLDLPAAGVEPVSASQLRSAEVAHVAACQGCPQRPGCPGIAAAVVTAAEDAGQPFAGWLRPEPLPRPPPPEPEEPFEGPGFDPTCAEARGMHLGLRQAWRLSLKDGDLVRFRALFEPLGFTVAASTERLDMVVGGTLRVVEGRQPDAERLVVVSRDPEVAETCLRAELGNLGRVIPGTVPELVADLDATLAVHRRLGAAYGYPACCVEAFCDAHTEVLHTTRLADNAIALLRAHLRTRRHDSLLDTLGGPATDALTTPLRHLPCRFDCPASLALAHALLRDLRLLHPARAHQTETQPVHAVVVFADGSFLRVLGQPSGPTLIEGVTSFASQIAAHASAEVRETLLALEGPQPEGTALRVTPGIGVALRHGGVWRDLDLGLAAQGPMPSRFPLLLPFQREPLAEPLPPLPMPELPGAARQALLHAVEHARASDFPACRMAIDAALRLAPRSALVCKVAGVLRFVTRDYDVALRLLAQVGTLDPAEAVQALRLAMQRAGRLGWEHELRDCLTRLAEREPREIAWVTALARLYADRRVLPEALEFARKAVALAPDAEGWLRLARWAVVANRPEEAIEAVARAAAADPLEAATILCDAGAFQQAQVLLERAEPTAAVTARRAQLALWQGRHDEAEVLARACPTPEAARTLGALALLAGELAEARVHLDAAIASDGHDDEAFCWRAELHLREGRLEDAIEDLDRAMLAAPGFPLAAWLLRAISAGREVRVGAPQARFGEALESLRILCPQTDAVLARRDPGECYALLWRALEVLHGNRSTLPTFLLDGELRRLPVRTSPRHASRQALETIRLMPPERVLAELDAVVARFPQSSLCPCHRGELHLWLGDVEAARRDLEAAVALQTTTRWAWIGLGGCELLANAPERALAVLERGVKTLGNTEGPAVFVYRGEALLRLGRFDAAVRDLTEALRTRPTRLAARLLLALALHGHGDVEGLRSQFEDLRARAAGLLSDAGRIAARTVWKTPGWLPEAAAMAEVCEAALALLQGNRSSTCTTWRTPEGTIRAVPHEARQSSDPNAHDDEDLRLVARWLHESRV
jgi:tetratricopeptide (TPR) repeat protein